MNGCRYSLVDVVREYIQTLPEELLRKLIEIVPHTGDRVQLILHFIYGVDGSGDHRVKLAFLVVVCHIIKTVLSEEGKQKGITLYSGFKFHKSNYSIIRVTLNIEFNSIDLRCRPNQMPLNPGIQPS